MSAMDSSSRKAVRRGDEEAAETGTGDSQRRDQLDADVDAILDEIDDVLEENAEDFVKSFVQKGGQ